MGLLLHYPRSGPRLAEAGRPVLRQWAALVGLRVRASAPPRTTAVPGATSRPLATDRGRVAAVLEDLRVLATTVQMGLVKGRGRQAVAETLEPEALEALASPMLTARLESEATAPNMTPVTGLAAGLVVWAPSVVRLALLRAVQAATMGAHLEGCRRGAPEAL